MKLPSLVAEAQARRASTSLPGSAELATSWPGVLEAAFNIACKAPHAKPLTGPNPEPCALGYIGVWRCPRFRLVQVLVLVRSGKTQLL